MDQFSFSLNQQKGIRTRRALRKKIKKLAFLNQKIKKETGKGSKKIWRNMREKRAGIARSIRLMPHGMNDRSNTTK